MPLHAWWRAGYERFVEVFSGFDSEDPARIFRGVLSRNAERVVRAVGVDRRGALFSSTCAALGAICRLHQLELREGDWGAARSDAAAPPGTLTGVHASALAQFVSPAEGFRQDAAQALLAAGVVPNVPSNVTEEARAAALELAASYLMRFLVAYAGQCDEATDPTIVQFRAML